MQEFTRSDHDYSLFINYEKQVILLLYVDDLVVAAPTRELIDWIREKLHDKFEITDLGPMRHLVGLQIKRKPRRKDSSSFGESICTKDHPSS